MVNKKHSDRERLFRLIRGDAGALKEIQRNKHIKIVSEKLKEFAFLTKQSLLEIFHKLRRREFSFSKLNLLSLRMVLVGILSVMIIYLAFDFINAMLRKSAIVPPAKYLKPKEASLTKLSPLDYYLSQIGGNDLFNPQRIELVKAKDAGLSGELQTGLKLVGVDWGGNPIALIEDIKTSKTYFVKKGESIKELKVMEIFRDRVKLRYNNKVLELK